jgi:DNA-binding response OmpR family regulator
MMPGVDLETMPAAREPASVETGALASPRSNAWTKKFKEGPSMPKEIRILILDDEIALLDTLADFLRDCGYIVYPVTQAEEASVHLRCGIVDLALLDVGAHGLRIAREAMTNGTPVILMSGYPVILETGAIGEFMRKPFSLAALRTNIEKIMCGWQADRPARSARAMEEVSSAG